MFVGSFAFFFFCRASVGFFPPIIYMLCLFPSSFVFVASSFSCNQADTVFVAFSLVFALLWLSVSLLVSVLLDAIPVPVHIRSCRFPFAVSGRNFHRVARADNAPQDVAPLPPSFDLIFASTPSDHERSISNLLSASLPTYVRPCHTKLLSANRRLFGNRRVHNFFGLASKRKTTRRGPM